MAGAGKAEDVSNADESGAGVEADANAGDAGGNVRVESGDDTLAEPPLASDFVGVVRAEIVSAIAWSTMVAERALINSSLLAFGPSASSENVCGVNCAAADGSVFLASVEIVSAIAWSTTELEKALMSSSLLAFAPTDSSENVWGGNGSDSDSAARHCCCCDAAASAAAAAAASSDDASYKSKARVSHQSIS